ncbi:hypothetical protein F511_25080 [Dorcoceras hygrometricum]|uniref:Dystroglycan-like n=1 Tax=Dorcoceras hygrometricum TaxID=472368 RepID=A0A2Z7AUL5_9LAMI|nr:hypothetical protein F511_25080 [Dorcoceras hygrometricum]
MAASLYSNSIHVDFDSVMAMDEPGMVSMFQALVGSGLQGFLGCSAVVYEEALVEFFANGRERDGLVVSSVNGAIVEISEELFAETFELPVDGLGDLSEMPKDAIFDARSIVSLSGEPNSLSGRKNQMKFEYRLLCYIMAKAISVKAGSFNAITVEKFSLMTVVFCSIRMNWAKFLFSILKKMVTPGSKQAKGFAIQISLLLTTFPTLELGESSEFPASKVLTKKTVHRFVSINDRDGAEEVTEAVKQRSVSKKRHAADVGVAVPKRKRTIKKKYVSSISTMELVAVAEEAIPIQQVLDETRAADAPADTAQPAVAEEKHWFDLPYEDLVKQWEAERPVVTASDTDDDIATVDVAPADGDQQVQESVAPISADDMLSADERMSLDDILLTIPVNIPLPSSSMEITKITMGKSIKIPGVSQWAWFLKSLPRIPAEDKGKGFLVEKDPVKGNPAKDHYSLICADIELLVNLRAQVIDEVAKFFHSFSLKKLASINFEEMYRKEEQVLSWGETESIFIYSSKSAVGVFVISAVGVFKWYFSAVGVFREIQQIDSSRAFSRCCCLDQQEGTCWRTVHRLNFNWEMHLLISRKEKYLLVSNKEWYLLGSHKEWYLLVSNKEGYLLVSNKEGYLLVSNKEGYLLVSNKEGYLLVSNKEGYLLVSNKEGYLLVSNKEGYLLVSNKEGYLLVSHNEWYLLGSHKEWYLLVSNKEGYLLVSHNEWYLLGSHKEWYLLVSNKEGYLLVSHNEWYLLGSHKEWYLLVSNKEGYLLVSHNEWYLLGSS